MARIVALRPPSLLAKAPSSERRIPPPMSQDMMRALDQQFAQVPIAALADPQLRIARAALPLLGPQPQKSRHIATVREALGPPQRQHEGDRGQLANTRNTGQPFHLRVSVSQLADLLVIAADVLTQSIVLLQQSA